MLFGLIFCYIMLWHLCIFKYGFSIQTDFVAIYCMWFRANTLPTATVPVPTVLSTAFGVYLCLLGKISLQKKLKKTAYRNLISEDSSE